MDYDLIDGNSWGYAAHGAMKLNSGDLETQAIFGFVAGVRELALKHPDSVKLVLWDGRKEERFTLCPTYKSNRESDPAKVESRNTYVEQRPYIARALQHLGIRQLQVLNLEADDVAGHLVGKLARTPENTIRLWSGDMDWAQLVRKNVSWRDKRDDAKVITLDNFFDKTGYKSPLRFLEGKCLMGDSSDVIPGVGGIGEGRAPLLIAEHGSVREYWRRCDSGEFVPRLKYEKNLASPEGRAAFHRNLRLMQLMKVPELAKDQMRNIRGKLDAAEVARLFEELAFNSLLRHLSLYLEPFQKVSHK